MAAATRQDATRVTKNHTFPRLCENPVNVKQQSSLAKYNPFTETIIANVRYHALIATTAILLLGILYSVLYGTYIDTSDPLLTHLAHLLPLFTYSTSSLAAQKAADS